MERDKFIAALRRAADLLESVPEIRVPSYLDLMCHIEHGTPEERRRLLEAAVRKIGPVSQRVVEGDPGNVWLEHFLYGDGYFNSVRISIAVPGVKVRTVIDEDQASELRNLIASANVEAEAQPV